MGLPEEALNLFYTQNRPPRGGLGWFIPRMDLPEVGVRPVLYPEWTP